MELEKALALAIPIGRAWAPGCATCRRFGVATGSAGT
jgi:hypothetical protein